MRFRDILGLALSALRQQKLRTFLTTLGVVFGSLVLVISLSVRHGVNETVVREYSKFGELRRIGVHTRYSETQVTIPAKELAIVGTMSAARRERLRRATVERWQRRQGHGTRVSLTRARLAAIAALPGVRSVEPQLVQEGHVFLGQQGERAAVTAALPGDDAYQGRILAGSFLPFADARSAVVSEYLLYRLGVADDEELARVVGKKIRLEYRSRPERSYLLTALFLGRGELSLGQEQALEKVLARLPDAINKLDLPDDEKAVARTLLRPPQKKERETVVSEELTICGVLRLGGGEQKRPLWWPVFENPDLILARKTAEDLFFRLPGNDQAGFESAVVEVERLEDVKEVSQSIEALGLHANSLAERAEREQFIYRLIFTAMTVVAVVALLVAALGILNTMLMSVLERVREIGVMKAVGARDSHIQLIFLVEGALVGTIGGLLGLLLAWGLTFPFDTWARSVVESGLSVKLESSLFSFPWWLVVGAPAFACAVTTVAALYPAYRAAWVDPVKALRHD